MRILVCPSGLKATTRQHGLTEYWSNRVTHCSSPKGYPRLFCWIYRHEGRKLKHELRCHAVLCAKDSIADQMCQMLKVKQKNNHHRFITHDKPNANKQYFFASILTGKPCSRTVRIQTRQNQSAKRPFIVGQLSV